MTKKNVEAPGLNTDSNSNKVGQYINLLTSYGLEITVDLSIYLCNSIGNDKTYLGHLRHNINILMVVTLSHPRYPIIIVL